MARRNMKTIYLSIVQKTKDGEEVVLPAPTRPAGGESQEDAGTVTRLPASEAQIELVSPTKLRLPSSKLVVLPERSSEELSAVEIVVQRDGVILEPVTVWRKTGEVLVGAEYLRLARKHHVARIPVIYLDLEAVENARVAAAETMARLPNMNNVRRAWLGMQIEDAEKELARKRQDLARRRGKVQDPAPPETGPSGKSRDAVARRVSLKSGSTYDRIRRVLEVATEEERLRLFADDDTSVHALGADYGLWPRKKTAGLVEQDSGFTLSPEVAQLEAAKNLVGKTLDIKQVLKIANEYRAGKAKGLRDKRSNRILQDVDLSEVNLKVPVIYADPAWRYEFSRSVEDEIENEYSTDEDKVWAAMPVADKTTPDAVLFLWVPAPLVPRGIALMEAWGFTYKTQAIWFKSHLGLGYYFRIQHEVLLVGTKGKIGTPPEDARPSSVIVSRAEPEKYSQKPIEVYEYIEAMYPDFPRLELFARARRPGWYSFGNELPDQEEGHNENMEKRNTGEEAA